MTIKENQKAKLLKYVAINDAGNFNTWNPAHIRELKNNEVNADLGQRILFENEYLRIWEVVLLPKERLSFRKMELDYCWVAGSEGMVISRFSDGKIVLMHLEKGDSEFLEHEDKHAIYDLENIGQDIIYFQMTEFKGEQLFVKESIQEGLKRNSTRNQ
ncbi:hypothetical protein [uncultured Muriicola sp.]|uniref:hypothetical protein n=1 Tax=uncultured Muriicola sp. TaxID=1583102 RepID=UPI0026254856|nr:hypothetical protein [uncultured Muriicola sp.]